MTTDAEEPQGYFIPSTAEPTGPDYGESPLRDFWSTGAGYEVKGGTTKKGGKWQRVYFRGIDVQVLESTVVYPLPTSEISIFYAAPTITPRRRVGQGTNDWEAFSESIRKILGDVPNTLDILFGGQVVGEGSQPEKPGKRLRLKMVPTLLRVAPNDSDSKWHDETVLAWTVAEVEGVTSETASPPATPSFSLQAYVLNLADGKDEAGFYQAAMDDSKVLSNPGLVAQLSDRVFLSQMVQLGQLSQDEKGVIHLVK